MKTSRKVRLASRRSVVISTPLMSQIKAVLDADPELNLNRLINTALREYLVRQRREEFKRTMAEMASDPAIQRESARITAEFMPSVHGVLN